MQADSLKIKASFPLLHPEETSAEGVYRHNIIRCSASSLEVDASPIGAVSEILARAFSLTQPKVTALACANMPW